MIAISRDHAISQGLPRYFTGKPCKEGHVAERFVANYTCCVCADIAFKKWYSDHSDTHLRRVNDWRNRNVQTVNSSRQKWASDNPDKVRNSSKKLETRQPRKSCATRQQPPCVTRHQNAKLAYGCRSLRIRLGVQVLRRSAGRWLGLPC